MRRTNALAVLALLSLALAGSAEDKKETSSLTADAAALSEKSGSNGWVSDEVTVSMDDGQKKARGKLLIHFTADKGKPSGGLRLVIDHGTVKVGTAGRFELVEKDGKQYVKVFSGVGGPKDKTEPEASATLEYTLKGDTLTVKDGVIRKTWAGWDVDLSKPVTFKAAGK